MQEESVNIIRESTRNLLKLSRRAHRDHESDLRRSADVNITPNVEELSNKLKTKASMSVSELHSLKNCLIDDVRNIEILLNTHGALRGLVRELSGTDVRKQTASAGCCCNLALGDGRASLAVAKAAGPYLVANLDSLTTELAVTSTWALGNLVGSDAKVCEILIAQGALSKLCDLLTSANEEIRDAVDYALVHFCWQMKDDLGINYIEKILKGHQTPSSTSFQLLFILSCHKDFLQCEGMTETLFQNILQSLNSNINDHLSLCRTKNTNKICCKLIYIVRILANLSVNEIVISNIVNYIKLNNLMNSLTLLLNSDNKLLIDSLLWFLGNIYNTNNELFLSMMS